jgi:hypothetical protein
MLCDFEGAHVTLNLQQHAPDSPQVLQAAARAHEAWEARLAAALPDSDSTLQDYKVWQETLPHSAMRRPISEKVLKVCSLNTPKLQSTCSFLTSIVYMPAPTDERH